MSTPSSSTRPLMRAPPISASRFRLLSSVDLPHPDGPTMAVIWRRGISTEMFFSACWSPYHTFRSDTTMCADRCAIVFRPLYRTTCLLSARIDSRASRLMARMSAVSTSADA